MSDPGTVRTYEWRGLLKIVHGLVQLSSQTRWLDFGCGLGGLVRHAHKHGLDAVYGYDEGYAARRLVEMGIPSFSRAELDTRSSWFDIVTAIEVLEHATDPLATLRQIRQLLRPGGVLFLTTGNAEPFRRRIAEWAYTGAPEVHVSFFEPRTLDWAYREVGLEPVSVGYRSGFTDVIRFKVLNNLRVSHRGVLERLVPWPIASRLVDHRYGVSEQPCAVRAVSQPSASSP